MTRRVVSVVLLTFVGVSLGYLVFQEAAPDRASTAVSQPPAVAASAGPSRTGAGEPSTTADAAARTSPQLIAYYFHRTQRCRTCLTIEDYAHQALNEGFPRAAESGRLEWRVVNVEEPANEHFVADYGLASSAVVLVSMQDGRQKEWRRLDRVWDLVGNEIKFKAYVEAEAMMLLEQDP